MEATNNMIFSDPRAQKGYEAWLEIENAKKKKTKPYYSSEYAKEAKAILDRLHSTGAPIRINADVYSTVTLKLQYYQGAEYLRDNSDHDGHYALLFRNTKCSEYHGYIELHVRRHARLSELASPAAPWKDEFTRFLDESVHKDKLHRKDISLSQEDINWVHLTMAPIKELFIYDVKPHELLVIRYDPN